MNVFYYDRRVSLAIIIILLIVLWFVIFKLPVPKKGEPNYEPK